ncbi:MAG TPA: hypothetical protein VKL40_00990 [Candidatus Angelobacter sp.]|nr:hypothetical protein [Candidatus Angelobacter sp.]
MRKTYVIIAIVLLSSLWVVAQNKPPTTLPGNPQQYPNAPPNQQQTPLPPPPPDTSQTANAPVPSDHDKSLEGCIGLESGSYTLTDSSGYTWPLTGDTSGLSKHVGHTVEASGTENPQGAFKVKKVKVISNACAGK